MVYIASLLPAGGLTDHYSISLPTVHLKNNRLERVREEHKSSLVTTDVLRDACFLFGKPSSGTSPKLCEFYIKIIHNDKK